MLFYCIRCINQCPTAIQRKICAEERQCSVKFDAVTAVITMPFCHSLYVAVPIPTTCTWFVLKLKGKEKVFDLSCCVWFCPHCLITSGQPCYLTAFRIFFPENKLWCIYTCYVVIVIVIIAARSNNCSKRCKRKRKRNAVIACWTNILSPLFLFAKSYPWPRTAYYCICTILRKSS